MSWFPIPKDKLEQEEKIIKRGYGKVKRISERKDYDMLPSDDDEGIDMDEDKTRDTNLDQEVDYSDDD
jgi:hypothetical protein